MSNQERDIGTYIGRHVTESILRPLLNFEVVDDMGGIAQAERMVSEGKGLVLGFTHFSKRDGPIYAAYALHYAKSLSVPVVLPIAHHQFEDYKSVLLPLARLGHGKLYPIVIDDTIQDPRFADLPLNQGMEMYMPAAVDAIRDGGMVALSLLGGRKSFMGEAVPALSTLMVYLHRYHSDNYAVQCVGISPKKNVESHEYTKFSGWNFLTRYRVRAGRTYTFQDLQTSLGLSSLKDFRKVDPWAGEQVSQLVQPSYLKQPNLP
jgi:hypothetical protein